MDVRSLDTDDDALLRRYYQIIETADLHERPWALNWSYAEMVGFLTMPVGDQRWEAFAAFEGDAMVGAGVAVFPLTDNRDKIYASYFVEPVLRRRGIGSALVEHTVDRAHADGRTSILTDTGVPADARETHPSLLFAKKHGFTVASVEVHRVLALPLPEADLDAMEAEAAPFHPDYEILTFHDDLPESLVPSYCFLVNQLAVDAPTGDVDFEAEQMTPEIYHAKQERRRRQGRHRLTSLAVRHGEAVGVTDLIVPPEDRPKVYQGVTLVRRDHRGRHLGAAVKLANLRAVQQRYPERSEIHTTNEETNATMIGINERLGFRKLELCPELLLRL